MLTIAMVWLGGQFVTQGVSDFFVASSPEAAVVWRGGSADALAALAAKRLQGRNAGLAARLAAEALKRSPLNGQALDTLGMAQIRLGAPAAAERTMTVAGRLGWRDLLTQVWLFRRDALAGDFEPAFRHADAIMRREDQVPPLALRLVATVARVPAADDALARRLADHPSWRAPLFAFLSQDPSPYWPDVDDALLTRLAAGPAPPTPDETALYLTRLVNDGRYGFAEAAWRRLSPAEAVRGGLVHDGDFEHAAAGGPFDWKLTGAVGWSVGVGEAPAGGRALEVQYDGVSPPAPAEQLLVLAPGVYRLSGRVLATGSAGAAPLLWKVLCADGQQVLVSVPAPSTAPGRWTGFSAELTAPVAGCEAQWLQLTADPGDLRKDIDVWFDDIQIAPVSAAPPPRRPLAPGATRPPN